MRSRLPLLALVGVLVVAAALHGHRAANPTSSYQSADERSYARLALNLAEDRQYGSPSTGMKDPLHWPPGAPMLFAAVHEVAPQEGALRKRDIENAYWVQGALGVGTALGAFVLVWLLVGWWPGVLAAALVGWYPPLVLFTGELLSEPLGAFWLMWATVALAVAVTRERRWGFAAAGALLGLTALTRADLLFVPGLIAALVFAWRWWPQRAQWRAALVPAALVAGCAALVIAPWTAYVSNRAGKFVPITQGSPSALFVGTFLPANGQTVKVKRVLAKETARLYPEYRNTPGFEIPGQKVLDAVAARHPELPRSEAISKEARNNIREYALGDPVDFGVMMLGKIPRMWTKYARGGARPTSPWIRGYHVLLVLGTFAGLLAGIWRGRSLVLAAVLVALAYSTALHMLVVANARYNLPLMPILIAGGVAGWFLWRRERAAA